jgi:hypothetical protein
MHIHPTVHNAKGTAAEAVCSYTIDVQLVLPQHSISQKNIPVRSAQAATVSTLTTHNTNQQNRLAHVALPGAVTERQTAQPCRTAC